MQRYGRFWWLLLLCGLAPGTLRADQSDDQALIQHRSQHAYNAVFGLPAAASRPVGTSEWQVSLEHGNSFMGGVEGEERLLLDGETTELTLHHRRRLGACWQGELVVPVVSHHGGHFDRSIDDFHQWFGFPDAFRDDSPYNLIDYRYVGADNAEAASVVESTTGVGDIRLSVQRSLGCQATADSDHSEAIARVGLKLPTGSLQQLTGSGRADLYLDIQSPVYRPFARWRTGAQAGLLLMGSSADLPPQRAVAVYGSLGMQFVLQQRWRLLAQLDAHTPFYESRLRELGDVSVGLSLGVRFLAGSGQTIEFTFAEDAAIDTTPDIVARLSWTIRPRVGRPPHSRVSE